MVVMIHGKMGLLGVHNELYKFVETDSIIHPDDYMVLEMKPMQLH